MGYDLIGAVVHVHDGARHAGFSDAIEHMVDERAAAERHQRLGQAIGSGTHARAQTGRKDHG